MVVYTERRECARVLLSAVTDKKLVANTFNGSTFSQSSLKKKKAPEEMALPKSVPTTTEALLLFHRIAHVNGCLGEEWPHAKMQ